MSALRDTEPERDRIESEFDKATRVFAWCVIGAFSTWAVSIIITLLTMYL